MSHTVEIDDEMLLKLQSESLAVAVYGMQDGREKLIKKDAKVDEKSQELAVKKQIGASIEIEELEKLRMENAKLMKMLDERCKDPNHNHDARLVAENEGFCAVTCNLF